MKRFLLLESEPLLGAGEVVLELPQKHVPNLALELSLLLDGLSDSVRLSGNCGASVVVTLGSGEAVSKANVRRKADEVVCFELGRNQAGYVRAVLLRAYRDGVAEVNHIHVEGVIGGECFDLTLMFERFREPLLL